MQNTHFIQDQSILLVTFIRTYNKIWALLQTISLNLNFKHLYDTAVGSPFLSANLLSSNSYWFCSIFYWKSVSVLRNSCFIRSTIPSAKRYSKDHYNRIEPAFRVVCENPYSILSGFLCCVFANHNPVWNRKISILFLC